VKSFLFVGLWFKQANLLEWLIEEAAKEALLFEVQGACS